MYRSSKPTSPGKRFCVRLLKKSNKSYKKLLGRIIKKQGRNNRGRITVRHRGGGVRKKYRIVDFLRNKKIGGIIEDIHYDPNRSAMLALILYKDGTRSYIIHINNTQVGDKIENGGYAENKIGNYKKLSDIPVGTRVCCIESVPGKGMVFLRSAGCYGTIISKEGKYVMIRMISGKRRLVHNMCSAVIGEVGNKDHALEKMGKAGVNRRLGIRPTVRGVAMNPVDHPHGGGEGKTSSKRHPVSPWGWLTKGYKTRKNKRTDSLAMQKNI
ncbi:50S ribosomal protein L2 [Candidatus Vidania fulgoroideorum]